MKKLWLVLAVVAVAIAALLVRFVTFTSEQERIGKLRAECSQRYMPECDELKPLP